MQVCYLINTTGSKMGMWEGCQHKSSKSEEIRTNFPLKDGSGTEEMQSIFSMLCSPLRRYSFPLSHASRMLPRHQDPDQHRGDERPHVFLPPETEIQSPVLKLVHGIGVSDKTRDSRNKMTAQAATWVLHKFHGRWWRPHGNLQLSIEKWVPEMRWGNRDNVDWSRRSRHSVLPGNPSGRNWEAAGVRFIPCPEPTPATHLAQPRLHRRQPQIPVNFNIQSTTPILLRSISCLSRYVFE